MFLWSGCRGREKLIFAGWIQTGLIVCHRPHLITSRLKWTQFPWSTLSFALSIKDSHDRAPTASLQEDISQLQVYDNGLPFQSKLFSARSQQSHRTTCISFSIYLLHSLLNGIIFLLIAVQPQCTYRILILWVRLSASANQPSSTGATELSRFIPAEDMAY